MNGPTPMLFVSHEGTLTGAPMALLHLVRWLHDHSRIEPHMAILRDGPLTAEFAEVGPTTVLGSEVEWPTPTEPERKLIDRGDHQAALRRQIDRFRRTVTPLRSHTAVYLNSAASVRLLHHLPTAESVITHIHELRSALGWSLGPLDGTLLDSRVDHFVAAADCVADNLVDQFRISPNRVTRVYEFVDPERVLAEPERHRDAIRSELGLADDALIVGGSGWADWRKGIDLFIQLARTVVLGGGTDVHFVWVGGLPGGPEGEQIVFDVTHSGVADHLHLVGLQSRSFDWYRAFDVLALTSREDPYPLVGLETALLEVPMICFERSGGMVELVRRSLDEGLGESGVIVPYLDVEAMADAALAVLGDPARRAAMGTQAAAIVQRDHQVSVAAPQILDVIERVVATPSTPAPG